MVIGRKAIRETLTNLKGSCILVLEHWNASSKFRVEILSKLSEFKKRGASIHRELVKVISESTTEASMVLMTFGNYVQALESYVSELDETFDKLLKNAEEKAKKEAEKQPKIPNPYK